VLQFEVNLGREQSIQMIIVPDVKQAANGTGPASFFGVDIATRS